MKKMKRILVALLSCTMAFACVAGLSACDQPTSSSPAASSSSEVTDSSSSDSTPAECTHSGGTATCTELAKCDLCGEAYGELAAHTWVEHAETPASCKEEGTKAHFDCENCEAVSLDGETATEESLVIPATGEHTYGAWTIKEEPTVETEGSAEQVCEVCGDVATAVLPVLTDLRVWGVYPGLEPTCTEAGYMEYTSVYGNVRVAYEAYGHKWVVDLGKPATCTEEGMPAHYVCTACDAQSLNGKAEACIIPLPALGHSWVVDLGKPATCTEEGIPSHYVCTVCEAQSLNGKAEACIIPLPALGHSYGEWTITAEPTEVLEGIAERECFCGDVDTVGLPALTDLRVWGVYPGAEPTCTEAGYMEYTSVYGNVRVEFPAFHDDSANFKYEEGLAPDCENAGYTEYYVCKICNEIVSGKEEIPANGHDWKAVEKVHENPCYATGTAAHYACACGAVSLDGETVATAEELVVDVVGHKWVGVLPQAATCTIEGYVGHYVCTVCEAESLNKNTEICIKRETLKGEALIAYHKANNTYVLGKNATCEEDGWIEHYTCAECEGTFDKDGEVVENVVIPATGHDKENLVNLYDLAKEECLKAGCPVDKVYVVLSRFFPNGRSADGYYCELGPVCANCFDVFAYFVIDETNGTVSLGEIKGYALTGIGHDGGEATCSEQATCERCGFYYGDYADRSDVENHDNWTMVKVGAAPTCVSKEEFAIVQCDDCDHYAKIVNGEEVYIGESYTEEDRIGDIDEDIHEWENVRPAEIFATCTEPATYQVVKCKDCNKYAMVVTSDETLEYVYINKDFTIEEITAAPALKHMKDGVSTIVDATCTEDAYCKLCNASGADLKLDDADETIYVAHHDWVDELTEVENPVCGKVTVKVAHYDCKYCDVVKLEDGSESTEAIVNGIVRNHTIVDATCTADAYCSNEGCGASGAELGEDKNLLKHHVWSEEQIGGQEDCINDGWYAYYTCVCTCCECNVIGVEENGVITVKGDNTDADEDHIIDCIEIPAKGHAWGEITKEDHKAPCTATGIKAHYECADCDAVSLDGKTPCNADDLVIAVKGHVWKSVDLDQENPCTEEGTKAHFLCEVCGVKSFDKEVIIDDEADLVAPVVGHVWGEEIAQKDPTCNTTGLEAHFECSVCGAWAQGDEKTIVTEEEITIPADDELHVCEDPSRFCSDKVVCDECHNVYEIDNQNPADHKDVNDDGKCDYCNHKFDEEVVVPPVDDGEGSEELE